MKLHSLRIEPKKPHGWDSEVLDFGTNLTELFGPNGCGKTPVIKSIAYALGYPVRYRDDIYDHCDSVKLTLTLTSTQPISVTRKIGKDFDVEVSTTEGSRRNFYNEREFSQYMLSLLDIPSPSLTSVSSGATPPYMATLLPLFYLDQDIGYTSAYRAPSSFIKDQHTEMVRISFGLPAKHSFDQKKRLVDARKTLDALDRRIVDKERKVIELINGLKRPRRPPTEIESELSNSKESLSRLKSSLGAKSDTQVALDALLYERKSLRRQISAQISDLESRIRSLQKIRNEIEIELNTLSLNEEARRLFASFRDICANPSCGLFVVSSESYGKSLLYLRDQTKDLDRNNTAHEGRIQALKDELQRLDVDIAKLEQLVQHNGNPSDGGALVEAIAELTRNLMSLQEEAGMINSIEAAEAKLVELLNQRNDIQDQLAALDKRSGSSDIRSLQVRGELRERIRHWLDVLQTRNVSREISIDADFDVRFGGEKLSQFTGSTLLRVVLAIRTATFEVYVKDPRRKLRFLILDTPRQQDIEREALARYILELRRLSVESDCQVIFSTTDYHYDCRDGDKQWSPQFDGPEQMMFLKATPEASS